MWPQNQSHLQVFRAQRWDCHVAESAWALFPGYPWRKVLVCPQSLLPVAAFRWEKVFFQSQVRVGLCRRSWRWLQSHVGLLLKTRICFGFVHSGLLQQNSFPSAIKACFSRRWKSSTSLQNKCRNTRVSGAKGWEFVWMDISDAGAGCWANPSSFCCWRCSVAQPRGLEVIFVVHKSAGAWHL